MNLIIIIYILSLNVLIVKNQLTCTTGINGKNVCGAHGICQATSCNSNSTCLSIPTGLPGTLCTPSINTPGTPLCQDINYISGIVGGTCCTTICSCSDGFTGDRCLTLSFPILNFLFGIGNINGEISLDSFREFGSIIMIIIIALIFCACCSCLILCLNTFCQILSSISTVLGQKATYDSNILLIKVNKNKDTSIFKSSNKYNKLKDNSTYGLHHHRKRYHKKKIKK